MANPAIACREVPQRAEHEGDGHPEQEDREVPGHALFVNERARGDGNRRDDRRAEREAASEEQRHEERERQRDVEPERPVRCVRLVAVVEDRHGDADAETDDDQRIEPVALRQRRELLHELLHGAKVADHADDRIGRNDDFRIILEEEDKIVLAADAEWVSLR